MKKAKIVTGQYDRSAVQDQNTNKNKNMSITQYHGYVVLVYHFLIISYHLTYSIEYVNYTQINLFEILSNQIEI